MSKIPLVTISCTVYNHKEFIRDALDGFVMQQTDFPFEVIVHDDASTDGTSEIVREYEQRFPDIIKPIYQKENQWSKGVRPSQTFIWPKIESKYVAFCEGDDYWTDPLKLQKQVDFLESHSDYVLTYHGWRKLDVENEILYDDVNTSYRTLTILFRNHLQGFVIPNEIKNGDTFLKFFLGTFGKFMYLDNITPAIHRYSLQGIWSKQNVQYKINEKIKTLELINERYRNTPFSRMASKLLAGYVFSNRKYLFGRVPFFNRKILNYLFGKSIVQEYLIVNLKSLLNRNK